MSWMFGADAKDAVSKEKTNRPKEWEIAAANRCIEFMILQQELQEEELEKVRAELNTTQVLFFLLDPFENFEKKKTGWPRDHTASCVCVYPAKADKARRRDPPCSPNHWAAWRTITFGGHCHAIGPKFARVCWQHNWDLRRRQHPSGRFRRGARCGRRCFVPSFFHRQNYC